MIVAVPSSSPDVPVTLPAPDAASRAWLQRLRGTGADRDVAITPTENDEFERLSLYHETTGGEAALARKRRDDVIRAGGHVYETPPLAKDMTMATPAE